VYAEDFFLRLPPCRSHLFELGLFKKILLSLAIKHFPAFMDGKPMFLVDVVETHGRINKGWTKTFATTLSIQQFDYHRVLSLRNNSPKRTRHLRLLWVHWLVNNSRLFHRYCYSYSRGLLLFFDRYLSHSKRIKRNVDERGLSTGGGLLWSTRYGCSTVRGQRPEPIGEPVLEGSPWNEALLFWDRLPPASQSWHS